ncbi:MAG: cytochrome c nitrite reductase small subunit [Propionibacteriaceae bacterium]|jgi:cytochrome c nitrite reductase small subunit|nr:cytochrome c nitrite reductase small subunit [Propionibacteriaceae bacterium]
MASAKKPSPRLRRVLGIAAAALSGTAIGIAIFGIGYSGLPSYFGSNPETCAQCHVMQDHYDAWSRGSHANVATCNDCHLPHDNIIRQYGVKAEDGVLHALAFTTGSYPENIVIRDKSRAIANELCLNCHDMMTFPMRYTVGVTGEDPQCTHCHSTIGHDI